MIKKTARKASMIEGLFLKLIAVVITSVIIIVTWTTLAGSAALLAQEKDTLPQEIVTPPTPPTVITPTEPTTPTTSKPDTLSTPATPTTPPADTSTAPTPTPPPPTTTPDTSNLPVTPTTTPTDTSTTSAASADAAKRNLEESLRQSLEADEFLDLAESALLYGSYNERASTLARLLTHYKGNLAKMASDTSSTKSTDATENNPNESTQTDQVELAKKDQEKFAETNPSESSQSEDSTPSKPPSSLPTQNDQAAQLPSTQSKPPNPNSTLYTAYYAHLVQPFLKQPNPAQTVPSAAIIRALLDWIAFVPLHAHIDFAKEILRSGANDTSDEENRLTPQERVALQELALQTLAKLSPATQAQDKDLVDSSNATTDPSLEDDTVTQELIATLTNTRIHSGNISLMSQVAELLKGRGNEALAALRATLQKSLASSSTSQKNSSRQSAALGSSDLQIALIRSLSSYQDPIDLPRIQTLITDATKEVPVRWTALASLVHYSDSREAETLLLDYTKSSDPQLSARAFYALSTFTNDNVHAALQEGTHHNHPLVRREALTALAQQPRYKKDAGGDPTALKALIAYKKQYDSDPAVRRAAEIIFQTLENDLE